MNTEAHRDRIIAACAVAACVVLLLSVAGFGAWSWSQYRILRPVESLETRAFGQRTAITPEVRQEIQMQKQAEREWEALRNRKP